MSDEPVPLELEVSGETVGEAKWLALRELERLHPGLSRDCVRFEVLSEGERGLLGVGTSPARVLARVDPADTLDRRPAYSESEELGERLREVVERIAATLGADCAVQVVEDAERVSISASGPGVGLLIGREGRTIDAVQCVAAAIARRLQGDGGKRVDVDAASYRERRRDRLTTAALDAAERARSTGRAMALEPMTASERKLVHLTLQDVEGVETWSEGEEPARYVVVSPLAG